MVKSEPKKKPQPGGFFQKFFRKPEKSEKEQRLTVQRSIPYLEMGRDGICRVEEHLYSKTVRFYDINYQLAQNEDKNTIFESWCDFLNYFDASIRFQLSFINHKSDMSEYNKVIQIEPQHDQFDDVRMEYAQMLKQQLAKGNNGLVRTKYITFSIEAKSVREAKPRLERIETDILNNFKVLGVKAYPLNGVERLQIMYETFHQEEQQKFDFSYDRILQSGMTTKDFIAPTSFLFKSGKDFMMGDTYGAASYLNILAPELTDKVLAEFLDMDKNLVVSIHVQSVDQLKAIKLIKGKITDLDRMKIEEQKKAVRSGYDMEIIPSDLATYGGEAKKILDDLQSRNERMFLVTVLFLNTAKTKQELDSAVFQTAGIAQKFNCTLNRLDYLQEQGLMSSLPLANNLVPIKRALTTTSTAIFVPSTPQELFMEGDSLYYGLNAVSNNMIMADRKQLKNPNGLILGTPGSGKSFSAKREITNVFFTTTDDIIVADPEGEYYPLVEALGGQVIHISSTSKDYINPMDINLNYADDDNPLGMKSDFILSLCELIMGARDGMEPEEKSVIDRCLPLVYQKYLKQAAAATNTITEKAKAAVQEIVVQHKTLWVGIGVGILLVMVMLGAFSSCGAAIQGTGSTFVGTTYPSKDADMKGAEEDYLELEKELDKQIRQMESTHPGYDEYRYQLDEIGHDPYQLISHLTAVYEQFTRGQVKPVIKELFKQQYLLKVWETIEIRTRMETRVGVRPTIDAFGNVSMETYTYQEEVEYEYKILNVLLKNKGFDTIARKNMNRKQTGRYDAYNLTYGNRPELFGAGSPTYSGGTTGSIGTGGGAGSSGGGFKYDIPSEALSDEKFARMIEEAEKYLGMPYVWGGSSPSTSFDCSGFVCWVINNSGNGWSVGRTTANGLRGKCSYVSPADAQPGDLIFFEKTYNTVGASHVGIYVGNGMMIHCGDPISYTSINSTYWQSHFLGFGRIN